MLTDTLKQHTKDAHLSVERMLVKRIQNLSATKDYIDLLKIFYGYFSALEERIAPIINTNKLPDYADRRKAQSLLNDMALCTESESASTCDTAKDLPHIGSHAEALGAMYVMEGSTLGGKIISKMITQKLGADAPSSFHFFDGYGEATDTKWESFKASLNDNSTDELEIKLTLSAALETFQKFKQWIERYDRNEKL